MTITPTDATTATARTAVDEEPSTRRLNIMRFGCAFMGVGLAIVKWPLHIQDAASLPLMDGVVTCLLTAMSLLAFLGLRYPVRTLPILLFDVAWKVLSMEWSPPVSRKKMIMASEAVHGPRSLPHDRFATRTA